jgi:hypothetical protein
MSRRISRHVRFFTCAAAILTLCTMAARADSVAVAAGKGVKTALPPIESIGAGSDIRGFLAAGVPVELTRAALRRAWVTDPAIHDFVDQTESLSTSDRVSPDDVGLPRQVSQWGAR